MNGIAMSLVRGVCTAVLGVVGGLVLCGVLPLVFGWSGHAIMTGSMTPSIAVGDVVLSAPVQASTLRPGMVVLFHDPENPAVVLAHRIRDIDENGELVTRGDANAVDDPRPVSTDAVIGMARLRVPYVGLLHVWLSQGQYGLVAAPLITIAGCALMATWRGDQADEPEPVQRETVAV